MLKEFANIKLTCCVLTQLSDGKEQENESWQSKQSMLTDKMQHMSEKVFPEHQ